jgi:hypothetical protein
MWEQWDREESNLALPGFDRPRRQQRFSPLVDQEGFEPSSSSLSARRPHRTGPLVAYCVRPDTRTRTSSPCSQSRRANPYAISGSCPPRESNPEPPAPEASASASWARWACGSTVSGWPASNRLSPAWRAGARPHALHPRVRGWPPYRLVERAGVEPAVVCVQSRCLAVRPPPQDVEHPHGESNSGLDAENVVS